MFPGPQLSIMDWMKHKMQTNSNHETLCSLALNEFQIFKAIQYNSSLKQFIRFINELEKSHTNLQKSINF